MTRDVKRNLENQISVLEMKSGSTSSAIKITWVQRVKWKWSLNFPLVYFTLSSFATYLLQISAARFQKI